MNCKVPWLFLDVEEFSPVAIFWPVETLIVVPRIYTLGISARGPESMDRAQWHSFIKDRGPIVSSPVPSKLGEKEIHYMTENEKDQGPIFYTPITSKVGKKRDSLQDRKWKRPRADTLHSDPE